MRCIHCGKIINGTYYTDWAGNTACTDCYNNSPRCVSCGQFCDSSAKDIDDGMMMCGHCQKYYMERSDARRMIEYINTIYEKEGLGRITNFHLKTANTKALLSLSGNPQVRGLAKQHGTEYTIFVYRHLSRTAFANVLSHEMLHIWQYERNIQAENVLSEGFCNLGSYVVLTSIGTNRSINFIRSMNANHDSIYGIGFRIMRSIYSANGWPGVIKKLTEKNNS